VHRRAANDYQFMLVSQTTMDERQAQAVIARAAASACGDLIPAPGKYRFEATEVLGGGDAARAPGTYRFVQEVTCVPPTNAATAERGPTLESAEDSAQIQADIRGRSEAYFRLIAAGQIDQAYNEISPNIGVDEATWKSRQRAFQALLGEPLRIVISRITVYDNPAQAREPGLYVAADYSNEYGNVPHHCGYLMWFRPPGGKFLITREETGHVTAEQLRSIPAAQHVELRQRLRCIAP
jgi:hypothetical protein